MTTQTEKSNNVYDLFTEMKARTVETSKAIGDGFSAFVKVLARYPLVVASFFLGGLLALGAGYMTAVFTAGTTETLTNAEWAVALAGALLVAATSVWLGSAYTSGITLSIFFGAVMGFISQAWYYSASEKVEVILVPTEQAA